MSVFDNTCGTRDVHSCLLQLFKIFNFVGNTYADLKRAVEPIKLKHTYLKPVIVNALQCFANTLSAAPVLDVWSSCSTWFSRIGCTRLKTSFHQGPVTAFNEMSTCCTFSSWSFGYLPWPSGVLEEVSDETLVAASVLRTPISSLMPWTCCCVTSPLDTAWWVSTKLERFCTLHFGCSCIF